MVSFCGRNFNTKNMDLMILCINCAGSVGSESMKISDWISIASIVVTSTLGLWIGVSVRKNFTINRSVKDYFILECQEIKKLYGTFLNCLYQNKTSSKSAIEWFKIMTIKIDIFEKFLKEEFIVDPKILQTHNKLKQYITETDEFNEMYNKPTFELTSPIKRKIVEIHEGFSNELTKVVIQINKARRTNPWKKHKS